MTEEQRLSTILLDSPWISEILHALSRAALPQAYLAAGCIAQTVWNTLWGYPLPYGISDADIIYYDDLNLTKETEIDMEAKLQKDLDGNHPFRLDVKNEARVHLWYEDKFGYAIAPYSSSEAAIRSFPTTATAVGVRYAGGTMEIYAPFGLSDLFSGVVRANKRQITQSIFLSKAEKWKGKWPELTIVPW